MCPDIEHIACLVMDSEPVREAERRRLEAHLLECAPCREEYGKWQTTTSQVRRVLAAERQNHPETAALLQYADHTAPGWQRLLIAAHLDVCAACRQDLEHMQQLDELERAFVLPADRFRRFARFFRQWFRHLTAALAAIFSRPLGYVTAVLAVAMAVTVYYSFEQMVPGISPAEPSAKVPHTIPPQPPAQTETKPPSLPRQEHAQRDRFKVLPHLDEMIGMTMRSESLTILSPPQDTLRSQQIEFRWQGEAGGLWLKIIDNQERMVVRAGPVQEAYRYRSTLPAGLYYWLLENEEEILRVGKFYIAR